MTLRRKPCALAIGGLDPGGGAGIAADLRAFHAAGVFGCAAIAVATIQSTAGLKRSVPLESRLVVAQAEEVLAHQRVRAVKVGALGSAENVRGVARWLARHPRLPVVVDPVFAPTRGVAASERRHASDAASERRHASDAASERRHASDAASERRHEHLPRLLSARAVVELRARLVPRARLVTANAPEAAALTGLVVETRAQAHAAAHALCRLGAHAALVKGGHLTDDEAIDVLAMNGEAIELRAPRLARLAVHGGGCVLASLIAARLASGAELVQAVRWAKRHHWRALRDAVDVGGAARVLVFRAL